MSMYFYVILLNLGLYYLTDNFITNPMDQGYAHALLIAFIIVVSPYAVRFIYRNNLRITSSVVPSNIPVYLVRGVGSNAITFGGITGATIIVGNGVLDAGVSMRDAVLLHEVGHARESHALFICLYVVALNIIYGFLGNMASSGTQSSISFLTWAFGTVVGTAIGFIPLLIELGIIRYFEKRADMYAARRGYAIALIEFLIRFAAANENTWYRKVFNLMSSHPLTTRRCEYLLEASENMPKKKGEILITLIQFKN